MLFLLAVLGVALRYGRGPAALASVLNVAAFDYLLRAAAALVQRRRRPVRADLRRHARGRPDRRPAHRAGCASRRASRRHRERRSHALFEVARDLSSVLATEQVVEAAAPAVAREFRARAHVLRARRRRPPAALRRAPDGAGLDAGTARWAFDHAQAAGLGTDTLPGSAWLYLPLKAPMRTRGVLARPARGAAPAARARAAAPARDLRRARRRSRSSASTTSRWRSTRRCRSSPSGCATRCSRRSRTTCARRSPAWSAWPTACA